MILPKALQLYNCGCKEWASSMEGEGELAAELSCEQFMSFILNTSTNPEELAVGDRNSIIGPARNKYKKLWLRKTKKKSYRKNNRKKKKVP